LLLPVTDRYLEQQYWSGNLRELANAVERACILSAQEVIGPKEFGTFNEQSSPSVSEQVLLKDAIERYERTLLVETLQLHEWRIAESAKSLGISRKSLWEKMRRYGIEEEK
jgi:DNA-binding NtrC family response regulator